MIKHEISRTEAAKRQHRGIVQNDKSIIKKEQRQQHIQYKQKRQNIHSINSGR